METGLFLQTGLSKPRRPTFHVWLRSSRKCAKPRDFIFQLYVSRDTCSQRNFSNTERDWAFALLSECGFNFTLSIVAQPVVLQVHGLRLVTPKAQVIFCFVDLQARTRNPPCSAKRALTIFLPSINTVDTFVSTFRSITPPFRSR